MHNFLASKVFPTNFHLRSKSLSKGAPVKDKSRSLSWDPSRSTSASPTRNRSAWTSTSQLSAVTTHSDSSAATNMSTEELDCYRSMRGTSVTSTNTLNSAMSSDAQELRIRLRSVQKSGEREKKVFDGAGQGYSILVTHDEVRVCHVDEKGEYHYRHLPLPKARGSRSGRNSKDTSVNNSAMSSRHGSRTASAERNDHAKGKYNKKQASRQVVKDRDGRTLVDITPNSVTVFHDGGVWRTHRMFGKIWDSDYTTHVTAGLPRAWSRRPSDTKRQRDKIESHSALDADELRRAGWNDSAIHDDNADDEKENRQEPVELLLCSNTPGEHGQAPRAFKSYYHDL